jgi:Fe-S cluster assembly protein SufD
MNAAPPIDIEALTGGWQTPATAPARPWLDAAVIRERALHTVATPMTREAWKYTPLRSMADAFADLPAGSTACWTGLDQPGICARRFSELDYEGRALVQDVLDGGLDAERHLLADLALLRGEDGWLVEVTGQPAQPIDLRHAGAGTTLVILVVREQAAITLIERQDAPPFGAQVLLADVGRGATLRHYRAAFPGEAGLWALAQLRVHDSATYSLDQQVRGGRRARLETHVLLAGRGASATLTGAYLVGAGEHLDQQLVVEHEAADTTSRQQFHGIGTGKGRSAFNGRIHIHPRATRSDAWLSNRNLALHAEAEMNTKPELEIYTDDVRCAHGATVGQLAADSLFFLTARGIPELAARNMLAHAFLRECIAGPLADEATPRLLSAIG